MRSVAAVILAGILTACGEGGTPPVPLDLAEVTMDFCDDAIPWFVAYQNEGGSWTRVNPNAATGVVMFEATPRVGLAVLRGGPDDYQTVVTYSTRAELEALNSGGCGSAATKSLTGDIANMGTDQTGVAMGGAQIYLSGASSAAFVINGVPTSATDLVAVRMAANATTATPNRIIVRRATNYTNKIPTIDWATEGEAPPSGTVSISGIASGEINQMQVDLITATTTSFLSAMPVPTGSGIVYGLPAASIAATDWHRLTVNTRNTGSTAGRQALYFYKAVGNKSIALGPSLATPTVTTVASTPSVRLRFQLQRQPSYGQVVQFFARQTFSSGATRDWIVYLSDGYVGSSATSWDVTMPDLSGVPGYPEAGFLSTSTIRVYTEATGSPPDDKPLADGDLFLYAWRWQ